MRRLLELAWWLIWGFGRWLKLATETYWVSPMEYWRSGRKTSWYPLGCTNCGWKGPEHKAVHTYTSSGSWDEDVYGVTNCPQCGQEI